MDTPIVNRPLRVVLIEDSDDDAVLISRALKRGGFDCECQRVSNAQSLRTALRDPDRWDVIIADYHLPDLDAMSALAIAKEYAPEVPFLMVSGIIDEDSAVTALKAGAHDFVHKTKLARLVPAVERELRDASTRTAHRRMQEQMVVTDRLASVGLLAAGVAHEINNPLGAALASISVARDLVSDSRDLTAVKTEVLQILEEAVIATERVRQIVRDVRIFSRGEPEAQEQGVDLHAVLDSAVQMSWNVIRHSAKLTKRYGVGIPPVVGTDGRLGQVFLNLLVNAAQAIGQSHVDDNEIVITTRSEDRRHVVIEISDTGPGLTPEVRERLFTPFLTTKAPELGTGLGLVISHRIVNSLGGTLEVDSGPGNTTFRISLPRSTAGPRTREISAFAGQSITGRRGRVLVVEDDPSILRAIQRIVSGQHDVALVESGAEALSRLLAGERYDVILCDMTMPSMSGMDLYAELQRVLPDAAAKMVFMTGGTFTERASAFLEAEAPAWIEKPFDNARLLKLLRERMGMDADAH